MKSDTDKVLAFIDKHPQWKKELTTLLKVIRKSKMEEGIKWGMPTFMIDGKNVLGFSAFKNYFGVWYFNGALLEDKAKVLLNAQSGKTIGMRQWRFQTLEELDAKLIHQYNQEAIANQKAGKTANFPKKKKVVAMPSIFQDYLDKNKKVAQAWEKTSPGKQNEFKEHIGEAKREVTKIKRLEKCVDLILAGKGLHDKYKK